MEVKNVSRDWGNVTSFGEIARSKLLFVKRSEKKIS
jgi:hypothetical protein